jgi:hypothetical protein
MVFQRLLTTDYLRLIENVDERPVATWSLFRPFHDNGVAHLYTSAADQQIDYRPFDSLARGPRNDLNPRIHGAFHGAILNTTP